MMFYSTNNKLHRVTVREAVMNGLALDGGLYMPESIPQLPTSFFERLSTLSLAEIGYEVVRPFLCDDVSDGRLREIVTETLNFPIPLVPVGDQQILELFHGPTLAFKDFGARFLARLMAEFVGNETRTILVATSGDTGSAVANGFFRVPGIHVVILFPKGKVSPLQEKQMTTLGENITAVAVEGTFDDCQRLVKEAFVDEELRASVRLSSANSINIARLLPQMIYYFLAVALSPSVRIFSVPSGNFGNLTAGLLAKRMGLSIDYFIAATNENDVVPTYLETAIFQPRPSIPTISNAMDVGNPSNFVRMLELYDGDVEKMRSDVVGMKISEDETRQTIQDVYRTHGYILDPHGAVAYTAIERVGSQGVVLETAHSSKFHETVEPLIVTSIQQPDRLAQVFEKPGQFFLLPNDFVQLKKFLLV